MAVETAADREIMLSDFGFDAQWTPAGGSPIDVRVIWTVGGSASSEDIGGFDIRVDEFLAETSEEMMEDVSQGDTITLETTDYNIVYHVNDGNGWISMVCERA